MLGDHHEILSSPLGPEARSLTQGLASSTIHDSTSTRRKVKKLRNSSSETRQMQARPLIQRTLHAVIALATAAAAAAAAAAAPPQFHHISSLTPAKSLGVGG
ncbi:hypothetical protein CABS03_07656 [Colletotrichum abscissum]